MSYFPSKSGDENRPEKPKKQIFISQQKLMIIHRVMHNNVSRIQGCRPSHSSETITGITFQRLLFVKQLPLFNYTNAWKSISTGCRALRFAPS